MFERKLISIYDMILDTSNYRIGKHDSQNSARMAIIEDQGKKLVFLAEDILENGLNPFDLPMVVASDDTKLFIAIEGNRRLTSMKLVLEPDLAAGTDLHSAFKKLNRLKVNKVPLEFFCTIAPSKKDGLIWIQRKHDKGLKGAGTEEWAAIAKERADADQGKPTPIKDALDFVEGNAQLDEGTKKILAGSKFSISNMHRLLGTSYIRDRLGISTENGKFTTTQNPEWVLNVLKEMVVAVANEKFEGATFNVSKIDSADQRETFMNRLVEKYPLPAKKEKKWNITGETKLTDPPPTKSSPTPKPRTTPSTLDRKRIIPDGYKLKLPPGKANDIFHDMKKLEVDKHPNAVSILFRVFMEFGIDYYIKKNNVPLSRDALINKFNSVIEHIKTSKVMSEKELKSITSDLGDKNSLISPNTWNAYVHNPDFTPDPNNLKRTWGNLQQFIDKIWQ